MTKHGATIQQQLAASLDKANRKEAMKNRKAPAPVPAAATKCKKLSISLFQTDLARLDAIRAYMAQRGEMISVSQAVKLALRTAPLSDKLTQALRETCSEDGRGKW